MDNQELDIVPGLSRGLYVFQNSHALLAADAWKESGPNIGKNGENLTISFLSMNRSTLSEKLLRSIQEFIPHFAGEVLVVDNGSSAEEIDRLRSVCDTLSLRTHFVELGKNHGVAGGRNRTIPHVKTEWLMCLDNDVYFISNPIPQIQRDLATLGCHFMSLPLLNPDGRTIFARGGHLHVSWEGSHLHVGAYSACPQVEDQRKNRQPFIGTFLFGGACVLNKDTFSRIDGYDEAMFVGFEDIDFSIRLFQQGYKVGAASVCALIHDHPKPASDLDRDYEKERFSRDILHKSAQHLEAKHGFKIWSDGLDHWLASRQNDLGISDEVSRHRSGTGPAETAAPLKPRIGLVLDTDGWAFANIARQLQRRLADRFDFIVIPMDIFDNIVQVLLLTKDCDLVHFFSRGHPHLIGAPECHRYVERLGISYEIFERRYVSAKKFTTSIYDHMLLEPAELSERAHTYNSLLKAYSVGSNKLRDIYQAVPDYPSPTAVLEDGVDLALFQPRNLERLGEIPGRELVVGWAGNSKWYAEFEDFKGVNTILKPAIERLRAEGFPVTSYFADRQERYIPHSDMPDYYAKIDLYICTSKIEGTPNPVLESMACGVPIISTDVGIVPQAFGPLQKRFVLEERSVDCLVEKLKTLLREPLLLKEMSAENLKYIPPWDWGIKANKFGDFFDSVLKGR